MKCRHDADCSECAAAVDSVTDPEVLELSMMIAGTARRFRLSETELLPYNEEQDVCNACCQEGIGQYFFDKKHGVCEFADICANEIFRQTDRTYLREI
jgi:hypothetical protein